jgi:hypothetical protein
MVERLKKEINKFLRRSKLRVPEEGLPIFTDRKGFEPDVDLPLSLDEAIAEATLRRGKPIARYIVPTEKKDPKQK